MAYNNFTLETVTEQFALNLLDDPFCESLPTADPQPEFLTIFNYSSRTDFRYSQVDDRRLGIPIIHREF
jgi:hypothetical protein